MPTFTLSARCSALPSSTDPDQHIAYILFVELTIHYTLQSVKFCRKAREGVKPPLITLYLDYVKRITHLP